MLAALPPAIFNRLVPGTSSTAAMESRFISSAVRWPVWKLATRVDSSGMCCHTISANSGVLRQWSSTAAHRVNWSLLCSLNSHGPVPAMFLLASSTPTSSSCSLLMMLTWGKARRLRVSYCGVPGVHLDGVLVYRPGPPFVDNAGDSLTFFDVSANPPDPADMGVVPYPGTFAAADHQAPDNALPHPVRRSPYGTGHLLAA